MESASLSDIRNAIKSLTPAALQALVLRLAKHKKENKELISYLLFDAADEIAFIKSCKTELDAVFNEVNRSSIFYIKKTLRKALRITNQYVKFSGSDKVEVELLLYFCLKMRDGNFKRRTQPVLWNLYQRQVARIHNALKTLHEDLRYDYEEAVEEL